MNRHVKGAVIAAAVAGFFVGGQAVAGESGMQDAAKVKCEGVNQCKGKGACAGAGHECAGKNSCKGKGWISLSKADCTAQGGTVK